MARGSSRGGRGPGRQELPARDGQIVRSPRQNHETAAALAEIWTVAAMEAAKPIPFPLVSEEDVQRGAERQAERGDRFGIVRGTPPQGKEAEERAVPTATTGGYDYPPPYTRYELPEELYDVYPWMTCGKVFFRHYGTAYVGSASSIGNYAIWTAGHIVHAGDDSPDGWATDMIFVPSYRNGNAPFGRWGAAFLRTTLDWYQKGNPDGLTADIGGAVLYPLDGQTISQRVGSLGFAWNVSRLLHWHSLGYPAASPFDGETMHDCQASYAYDGSVSGVPPVAIGCDMTPGCSGGPWIYKLLDENALNGNNSYRLNTHPEEMNSPYFDDRAKALYDLLIADTP